MVDWYKDQAMQPSHSRAFCTQQEHTHMQTIARLMQCNQKQLAYKVSTGQVTSYAGATLLLAAWLVTGKATG